MSWGRSEIIVPSPRARRKSRPLSMIYENPDDNNADPNTNPSIDTVCTPNLDPTTTTNYTNNLDLGKKSTHQELTRSLSPSPQTTRATTPTRRKAVAPLQHPVTILLDNQSQPHQSHSTRAKQLHDLSIVRQTNIQTTHSTPAVHSNSILKQFSSLDNSNAGGNSSQVTNNSHSTVLIKTASKYKYNENSKAKNNNCTTLNDESNTRFTESIGILEEEEDDDDVVTKGISKSSSDFTTNKDNICTFSNYNGDVTNSDFHSCSVSHNENVCCQCLKHENTCKNNDNIDGDENDRDDNNNNDNNDRRTSNINCRSVSFLDGYSNDDEIPVVSQPLQVMHSKHETYPHPLHQRHPHKMAPSINDEVHSPIKHNQDIEFISSIPDFNSTAATTTRIDSFSDPRHNNQTSADSRVAPESDSSPPDTLKHQRLSADSVVRVDTKNTKESQSNLRRSDNEATSEKNTLDKNTPCSDTLHKNTQDNNTPTKNTLDSDTLEWKRRVTRSVSFIKVSNTPESPKTRRRVSFTQPSNLGHSNTAFWKYGHRIHSNAMNTTTTNSITTNNNINSNNSIYNKSAILGVSNSNENKDTSDRIENLNDDNNEPVRRISAIDQSDFSLLKVATTRLNLPTRRPSFTAWKEKYLNRSGPGEYVVSSGVGIDTPNGRLDWAKTDNVNNNIDNKFDGKDEWNLTEDIKNRIDGSIAWLRQELIDIRLQDQSLARQFLNLRHAMNAFRLAVECEGHQELIDDAEEDMEEVRELSQLVDIPPEMLSHLSPLKQVGITRMNISCRRFSTC